METIRDALKGNVKAGTADFTTLEFGCGEGYQIPFLRQFGTVVASDIYASEGMKGRSDIEFVVCPIQSTPFEAGRFDLVFSNHVMQYIPERELGEFYKELARIGKPDCLYAFSVPTGLWLTLALPAQYYEKLRWVMGKIFGRKPTRPDFSKNVAVGPDLSNPKRDSFGVRLARAALPIGSGSYHPFWSARRKFRVEEWIRRFESAGFTLVRAEPLLLYAPSEWPIVPTSRRPAQSGFASSMLLVFRASPVPVSAP